MPFLSVFSSNKTGKGKQHDDSSQHRRNSLELQEFLRGKPSRSQTTTTNLIRSSTDPHTANPHPSTKQYPRASKQGFNDAPGPRTDLQRRDHVRRPETSSQSRRINTNVGYHMPAVEQRRNSIRMTSFEMIRLGNPNQAFSPQQVNRDSAAHRTPGEHQPHHEPHQDRELIRMDSHDIFRLGDSEHRAPNPLNLPAQAQSQSTLSHHRTPSDRTRYVAQYSSVRSAEHSTRDAQALEEEMRREVDRLSLEDKQRREARGRERTDAEHHERSHRSKRSRDSSQTPPDTDRRHYRRHRTVKCHKPDREAPDTNRRYYRHGPKKLEDYPSRSDHQGEGLSYDSHASASTTSGSHNPRPTRYTQLNPFTQESPYSKPSLHSEFSSTTSSRSLTDHYNKAKEPAAAPKRIDTSIGPIPEQDPFIQHPRPQRANPVPNLERIATMAEESDYGSHSHRERTIEPERPRKPTYNPPTFGETPPESREPSPWSESWFERKM